MRSAATVHGVRHLVLVGFWLVLVVCWEGMSPLRLSAAQPSRQSNDVQLVVDGTLYKTWTVTELLAGRFDWESPRKRVFPAVPIFFVLFHETSGLSPDTIAVVTFRSAKRSVKIAGKALVYLEDLLLKLDIDKGGLWKLGARNRQAEQRIAAAIGADRVVLKNVRRIEVVRKPHARD